AAGVTPVLDAASLAAAQADVARVTVSADVLGYAVDLARGTRQSPSVKLGVSPRGTTALLAASRAWAWLTGSTGVTPDHIQAMALPVLRHRIQLRPEAELEGVGSDAILRSILQQVKVPI
ncbi:MAG: MoxR family ATPase, partial [Microbacteriaceae bacterium]